jgi:aryl-alcohol dehydrogenase-like predicted oxidoreductase
MAESKAGSAAGAVHTSDERGEIPRRPLGSTGVQVSILALGGWHLGHIQDAGEVTRIVHDAIDAGMNFFDNAWDYHDGRSELLIGNAVRGRREEVFLMSKVCTHGRGKDVALRQLDESLRRLQTDYLDLWQIHECIYENEPDLHFAPGGVIEALDEAKQRGKVRFVGFTGHKHPDIHLRMLAHGYPFDTVQLPLNCFDATFRSFEQRVLPEIQKREMAALGMKSLGGDGRPVLAGMVTAAEALGYALSLPVAAVVTGIDSREVLLQNLAVARGFTPMTAEQMDALRARVAEPAADGRFELYKTTGRFDGDVAREQHGFPPPQDMPL